MDGTVSPGGRSFLLSSRQYFVVARCSKLSRRRSERARAARGVPRRDAASDEAGVEAALDERLRHVAPDVEAVGAVNGHRLVRRQLGDPLLDAIRIAPRRARSTCLRPGPCLSLALGILTLARKLLFRKCENIEPGRVPFQPEGQFLRLGEGCL